MVERSDFGWFDLQKYEKVSKFDIADWHLQLEKRYIIYKFSKENPETIERLSLSRWEFLNRNANNYIRCIKENPFIQSENKARSIPSVRNANFYDFHLNGIQAEYLKKLVNFPEDRYSYDFMDTFIIPTPDKGSPFDKALLSIDLGATNEQLIQDFEQWLKHHRSITNYEIRDKKFTDKDFQKWTSNKALPYLDLTLIAEAEDIPLTQNILGRLLFPDEYNVDLTERIRRSVKPLANWLLNIKTIEALRLQGKSASKY